MICRGGGDDAGGDQAAGNAVPLRAPHIRAKLPSVGLVGADGRKIAFLAPRLMRIGRSGNIHPGISSSLCEVPANQIRPRPRSIAIAVTRLALCSAIGPIVTITATPLRSAWATRSSAG